MFLPDNTHLFCTSRFYVLAKTQGAQRETPKRKNERKEKEKRKKKTATVGLVQLVECWPQFVQKVDTTIHWINHNPVDSAIGFPNTYPLYSELSDG